MKILGIACSPRKNSNTEILVNEALRSAGGKGAETELVSVAGKKIAPCDGCEACMATGKCRVEDDMQEIYRKLLEADGVIFGSPVYFWDVSAQAKAIIDRTYAFMRDKPLRNKVAGAIVVARRSGTSTALNTFDAYFSLQRMIPARSVRPKTREELARERGGQAIGYADKKGEITGDRRAMAEARALGESVAEMAGFLKT